MVLRGDRCFYFSEVRGTAKICIQTIIAIEVNDETERIRCYYYSVSRFYYILLLALDVAALILPK